MERWRQSEAFNDSGSLVCFLSQISSSTIRRHPLKCLFYHSHHAHQLCHQYHNQTLHSSSRQVPFILILITILAIFKLLHIISACTKRYPKFIQQQYHFPFFRSLKYLRDQEYRLLTNLKSDRRFSWFCANEPRLSPRLPQLSLNDLVIVRHLLFLQLSFGSDR